MALLSSFARALSSPANIFDEGFIVDGAARLLEQEVPYRDFISSYGPGQYVLLGGAFALFGKSLLVERIVDALLRTGFLLTYFVLLRRIGAGNVTYVFFAGAVGIYIVIPAHSYPMTPALILTIAAVLFAGRQQTFVAGVLVGLCAVFRPDVGAASAIAVASVVIKVQRQANTTWPTIRAALVRSAGGAIVVLTPVACALLVVTGIAPLWQYLVYEPLFHINDLRRLPLPGVPNPFELLAGTDGMVSFFRSWQFWGLFAIGAPAVALYMKSPREAPPEQVGVLTLLTAFTIFGASRADDVHLFPAVLMLAIASIGSRLSARTIGVPAVTAVLCVGTIGLFAPYFRSIDEVTRSLRANILVSCRSTLPRASCLGLFPGQDDALQAIRRMTQPNEAVFIGLLRHDRIFVNDILSYFLIERVPATSIHHLGPGQATKLSEQERIIADLERTKPAALLLLDLTNSEPNQSGRERGSRRLDVYLRSRYSVVATYGNYSVWSPAANAQSSIRTGSAQRASVVSRQ